MLRTISNGRTRVVAGSVLGFAILLMASLRSFSEDPPPVPAQPAADSSEVLAHGPVHEAYAKPTTANPEPGPIVEKEPPEPIAEVPPDQKPEGDEVEWIPGYWAWDEDDKEFDWVSGFWREAPPGRDWVPGHWQEVDRGWMWVSGYWESEKVVELQYLPAPPPTEETGPSTPAPDATSSYVPGLWVYRKTGYFWRPGFWIAHRPGWVWIPAGYLWTPTGYLYCDGFWDHPFGDRGLLFAPVRFGPRYFATRRTYTPGYAIRPDFLFGALFVGPGTRNYYFGNYFEDRYARRGFVTWPDYRVARTTYDPNFNYFRHQHANDARWEAGMRDLYRLRTTGEVPRPPRTLAQQTQTLATLTAERKAAVAVRQNLNLTNAELTTALAPLKDVPNSPVTGLGKLGQQTGAAPAAVTLAPYAKDARERDQKATERLNQIARQRREAADKMLQQGGVPFRPTDPVKTQKFERPPPIPRPSSLPSTPPVSNPPVKPPTTPPGKLPPTPPPVKPPVTPPEKPPASPPAKPPAAPPSPKKPPQLPNVPKDVQKPIPDFKPPAPPAPRPPKPSKPPKKKDG